MHLRFSQLAYKHLMITSGSVVENVLCLYIYIMDALQIFFFLPPSLLVFAMLLSALV